jgi:hypothetical protein
MNRKRLIAVGVLVITVVLLAYFISVNNTPPKAAPVKIGAEFVGICTHWLSTEDAKLVKESGAGWIRMDASVNFSEAVVNAKAQNLSVLGILGSWMFNGDWENFTLLDWQNNVTSYVVTYADFVDAWEIWNEPSHPVYTLSKEKYREMVQSASPIIRQYDPSAKIVLFGGLHLYSGGDTNLDLDKAFAKNLSNMDIMKYGDALSVHAYPWNNSEPIVWGKYAESLNYYRDLFGSVEVWVTETGKPLEEGNETITAQYLSDAYKFFGEETDVAKVFWYSVSDNYSLDEGKSFGLTIRSNQTRIAYGELQKITNSTS